MAADGVGPAPSGKGGQGGAPHDVVLLPLKDLKLSDSESQVERRAHFDKAALKELAVSIEAQGMLQAIVVRRLELVGGKVNHVVVAGERRYLAAQIAGWTWVPCNVRTLTDQQVIELQLVENLQREGLHELAEAEAYEQLQELGLNAEQIAAKCGRSPTYVLRRLRLKTLSKACRRAFYDGKLGFTVALELAKVPIHAHQDAVLKDYVQRLEVYREPMSADDVREEIESQYLSELKSAPFPTGDATLYPIAGACHVCPRRTVAQAALFDKVPGMGQCLDLPCFNAKKAAHGKRLLSEAKDRGQKVITGAAAEKIAPHGRVVDGFVDLSDQPQQDRKNRSWKQLLGDDYLPTLVQTKSGQVIQVAPIADAKKVLPKVEAARDQESASDKRYKNEQRAADRKRKLEIEYRAKLLLEINGKPFFTSDAGRSDDLRLAIANMADRLHHDGKKRLFKVMGWEPVVRKGGYMSGYKDYDLKPYLKAAVSEAEQWKLLRILAVAGDLEVYSHSDKVERDDRLHQLAERLGVNAKQIHAGLKAAAEAKLKPKKKAVRK